jgi:apolipoprotein N-acyltransferase
VEAGRPVVQAALSGTSAAFDARGRRLAWRSTGWRGAEVVEVPLSGERTPYVRAGDWLPGACAAALALGVLGLAAVSRGGSGRRTGSTPRSMPARPRP